MNGPGLETICVRLLRRCNLECTHCWAGSSPREKEELSSTELLDFLRLLKQHGLKHVSLSGGEPFLYEDLSTLVVSCVAMGLYITVTTNGFMGSRFPKVADNLGFPKDHRLRVRVSVDGPRAVHDKIRGAGSYDRAVAAVRGVKDRQQWVAINTVVTPGVYDALPGMLQPLRELGIDEWSLIAPLAKGHYRGAAMESSAVRSTVARTVSHAERVGFPGRVRFWDFQVRERGHLVLESDGRILMPGFTEERDRDVGSYHSVDVQQLLHAVAEDAAASDVEFYSWRGWSREPHAMQAERQV